MNLLIIRHAKAHRDSATGRDDERLLTPRGERQAEFLARALGEMSPRPDLLLSSGILRAAQTAVVIQRGLRCALRIEPALSTDTSVSAVLDLIGLARSAEPRRAVLALVGHNPTLEGVIARLTAASPAPLRTGEAVELHAMGADSWREAARLRLDDQAD